MFGQDQVLKPSRQESMKTKDNDETNSLGKMSSELGRQWWKSEKVSSPRMGLKEWKRVHCDGAELRADSCLSFKRRTQEGSEGF